MKINNFFAELKRRNVYKVAVAYAVVAWLTIQAASIFLPAFNAPQWAMQIVILILVVGFPIALAFSWAFEITPEGIVRESEVTADESITHHTGRKIVALTIVLAVVATGLLIFQFVRPRSRSTPRQSEAATVSNKSIAVLPFDNLSDDKSNAYFTEGVQDEILTRLAKVSDLKVIARTSTQRFKSAPENLPDIARQLGVANILEGSVQKVGDQVRVNVQLINAMTNAHLWADIYDRKLTDIFAVESDIAKSIADTLRAKLSSSAEHVLASRPTENPEAHELYLRGRYFWNRRTGANLQKAADYFQQAIGKDPAYALAYSGLADCHVLLPAYAELGSNPRDELPKALESARKAVELDDALGEAHASLARALASDLQLPAAMSEFKRAIELNPNYATAHQWIHTGLEPTGQFDRSIAETKHAIELDPLSLIINADLAYSYFNARRFDDALAQSQKTLEIDPSFHVARGYLGLALQFKGQLAEAIPEFRTAAASNDEPFSQALLGQALARAGMRDEAQRILSRLEERARDHFVTGWSLAVIRLALGDKEGALAALDLALQQHAPEIVLIKYDPLFDDLRGDPHFEALVQKVVGKEK